MESGEQYLDDIMTLGRLLDSTARAEEIIAFFQARLDRIDAAVSGLSDADKPAVLLVRYSAEGDAGLFEVPPATWLQTRLVEIAGGAPVWKDASPGDGWNMVNFEQVDQWNPDQIFVVVYRENAAAVVQDLIQSPEWQALDAVKNNQVYGFPADVFAWDSPDPRWILGVTWLAQTIHPDLFADVDMFQEIHDFFQVIYGMDATSVELNIFPKLTGDWQ
jgi:iron complex transport system substrate-binding protein